MSLFRWPLCLGFFADDPLFNIPRRKEKKRHTNKKKKEIREWFLEVNLLVCRRVHTKLCGGASPLSGVWGPARYAGRGRVVCVGCVFVFMCRLLVTAGI